MKVTLVKFCDYAGQLTDGGKHFMFGLFNTIGAMEFPVTHPNFFICFEFEFEPVESGRRTVIDLRLIDEDGAQLLNINAQFTVPPSHNAAPVTQFQFVPVPGVTFPKPGTYRLDVLRDGFSIGEARLYVTQAQRPGQAN